METLGPSLIGLAATTVVLAYWLKLRALSHEERMEELRRGVERASPFAKVFAARLIPLWILAFMGVGFAGVSLVANLGPGPGPGGGGVQTGRRGGGTTPGGSVGAPNTPTVDAVVDDTSTWRVTFSAFVGSGADTQDSIHIQVDRSGGNFSSPLTDVKSGVQLVDTLSDNTDWKNDSTYIVRGRQRGSVSGLWSAYDSVTVVNTTTPLPSDIYFKCSWPTTGANATALKDCGTNDWESANSFLPASGSSDTTKVLAVGGGGCTTGWPAGLTNKVQMIVQANGNIGDIQFSQGFGSYVPTPAIGDSVFARLYRCDTLPDSEDDTDGTHGEYFGPSWGPLALGLYPEDATPGGFSTPNGKYRLRLSAGRPGCPKSAGGPGCYWEPMNASNVRQFLSKNVVYRYEFGFIRTGTSTYQLRMRIYDSAGALVFDEDDFHADASAEGSLSADSLLTTAVFTNTNSALSMTAFRTGYNGFAPIGSAPFRASERAAVAICSSWCGPYRAGVDF